MNEISARSSVIALLNRFENDDDAEVLAAAREVHAKVSDMGVSWDALLVPEDDSVAPPVRYAGLGNDYDDDDEEGDDDSFEPAPDSPSFEPVGEAADDVKRIEQLKAMPGVSDALKAELDDFLEDIKENEFTVSDRQYIAALQQRLSKGPRKTS